MGSGPQAFSINLSREELLTVSSENARDVVNMELTLAEFADAIGMPGTSTFVTKVRHLICHLIYFHILYYVVSHYLIYNY